MDIRRRHTWVEWLYLGPVFRDHPRGLAPLFFTEMWERFSFYTMMALLTLYMDAPEDKGGLGFAPHVSSQIYGLYVGLVYFTPFFGGLIADKIWGYSRTIIAGGFAMMAGHLALAGDSLGFFFAGLCLLIIGNGLFKPNISTMLGNLYRDRTDQKDQGYAIFYMGINIGALIGPLAANFLKLEHGWHAAFGCASGGMLLSLIIFLACRRLVAAGEMPALQASQEEVAEPEADRVPPEVQRVRTLALLIIFSVVVFFWMAFKQNGVTLTRWARDHTEPVGSIDFKEQAPLAAAINPFLVIVLTPLLVMVWAYLSRAGREVSTPRKMVIGMILTMASCSLMGLAGLAGGNDGQVTVLWLISGYFFMTLGELCISPIGLSVVSKLAPSRSAGIWMGGWFVATSVGNYLAGFVSILWTEVSHSTFFFMLAGTSMTAALILVSFLPRLEAAMDSLKKPPLEMFVGEDAVPNGQPALHPDEAIKVVTKSVTRRAQQPE